jgi:hypothetical protein
VEKRPLASGIALVQFITIHSVLAFSVPVGAMSIALKEVILIRLYLESI